MERIKNCCGKRKKIPRCFPEKESNNLSLTCLLTYFWLKKWSTLELIIPSLNKKHVNGEILKNQESLFRCPGYFLAEDNTEKLCSGVMQRALDPFAKDAKCVLQMDSIQSKSLISEWRRIKQDWAILFPKTRKERFKKKGNNLNLAEEL